MDMVTLAMAKGYADSQRLGYTEKSKEFIFPETSLVGEYLPDIGGFISAPGTELFTKLNEVFARGQTGVSVVFNGKTYVCSINKITLYEVESVCIGNNKYFGGEDTGEPFGFVTADGMADNILFDTEGEHTFAIYVEAETIHTIAPKYLPGAVLPVVELSTVIEQQGDTILSAEDCQKLDTASETGNLCVLRFNFGGPLLTLIPVYMGDGEERTYSTTTPFGFTVVFVGSGGTWAAQSVFAQ